MLIYADIACPHCGESFETAVDLSGGSQQYVEDCAVCCRPIVLALQVEDEELVSLVVRREQD